MTAPAVRFDHVTLEYGRRRIWTDLSLEVAPGSFIAVLGPNGAGKTSLLRAILGLVAPTSGRIEVLGKAPRRGDPGIGYVPQHQHFDAETPLRGRDLVRLGLDGHRWGIGLPNALSSARVTRAIASVESAGYADAPIGRLSGGEQQRLLIAQALVSRPSVLILDEPLDSLDLPNQTAVAALLDRIGREQQVSVLLVAHDVNPLLSYLDRVVYFGAGHAAVGTPREVITAETLSRLYGLPIEVLSTADGRLFVAGLPEAPAHHSDRHEHH